ncbi:hypothetical protein SAMD00019534_047600, partial [Acytostelium subglobosum LB1]|uniref:hypothetical protein n=1 Tax=Acytostelium subglobosum LB1 TaxID=1410327 RepID=UPI000644F949
MSSIQSSQGALSAASSSAAVGVIATLQAMISRSTNTPFGNQIVLGIQQGIGYLLIGTGVALMTSFARNLFGQVKHSLFVTITVDSKDKTFEALLQWMSNNVIIKRATQLNAETVYFGTDKNPRVIFVPSVGKHRISYKGKTVWINRIRDATFDMASGAPFESIELSSFGTNTAVLQSLIDEAMRLSLQRDEGKTVVYINGEGSWTRF